MFIMRKRVYEPEIMDLGSNYYSEKEYNDCLKKLSLIGTLLGSDTATIKAIKKINHPIKSIVDIGCGGGGLTLKLAKTFPNAKVSGIDVSAAAIKAANIQKRLLKENDGLAMKNVVFKHKQIPVFKNMNQKYDVVTASLVCHHLNDNELVEFVRDAKKTARHCVVLNDLHRHVLSYGAFYLISPLFNNRLIRHDGLVSIRRSFRRAELVSILQRAGINKENFKIKWQWPFRFIITISNSSSK